MSLHPSYGKVSTGAKKQNVLPRRDRIKLMKERDVWRNRASVFALPKTKVAS